jgi:hypothetical protein
MDSDKTKKIITIVQNYNRVCTKLLNMVESIIPDNPKIYIVTRVFNMVKRENPAMLIEKGIDKLWDNKDHIINKDIDFFKQANGSQYIKNDSRKEWLTDLVAMLKGEYENLNEKEIEKIWESIRIMLECVIQYKLIKQDYK